MRERLVRALRATILIACVLLWTDSYPVLAPGDRLYQEVKIELCDIRLIVESRIIREVQTADGPESQPLGPWSRRATLRFEVEK